MAILEKAEEVLREAGEPLHAKDIAERMIAKGIWSTSGKTPGATVNARLAVDIKRQQSLSRFQRTGRGVFALREWGLKEYIGQKMDRNRTPESESS